MFTQLRKQEKNVTKPAPVLQRTAIQRAPYYSFHLPDSQNTAVTAVQNGLCVQDLSRHFPVHTESLAQSGERVIQAQVIINGRDPYLYGEKVKAYLIRGARPLPGFAEYPNPQTGYGALCLQDSLPL